MTSHNLSHNKEFAMSPDSNESIERLRNMVDHREIDLISCIEQLELKVKRRDETIRELRRTVLLELLNLQTNGVGNDANRFEIQRRTVDRLRQDETLIEELSQKVKKMEADIEQSRASNCELRMNNDAETIKLRHRIDELEFNERDVNEHVKFVDANMQYLNIVMIGKDAIIETQYGQLQSKDVEIADLRSRLVSSEAAEASTVSLAKSLQEEINVMKTNCDRNFLLERVELLMQENLALKKTLADYKAGYCKLTENCTSLAEKLERATESLEHAKSSRRKSKIMVSATIPELDESSGTSEIMNLAGGETSVVPSEQLGPPVHARAVEESRRRRTSSSGNKCRRRVSGGSSHLITQSPRDLLERGGDRDTTSRNAAGDGLTRIQMRRLRAASLLPEAISVSCTDTVSSTCTDTVAYIPPTDKQCQVNIDSSCYANVRMGNEEEVVVRALYRRVTELEQLVQDGQAQIDTLAQEKSNQELQSSLALEKSNQELQSTRKQIQQLHASSDSAIHDTEYQSHCLEEIHVITEVKQQKEESIEFDKIKEIQTGILAKQSEPVMECKSVQCEALNFTNDAIVQARPASSECSTQTSPHTPSTNHQTSDDPFYSYIFKELLDVCKHVVSIRFAACTGGEGGGNAALSGCKNLISSLIVLRKDLFKEMKYRGGEYNTQRSRSFLRCIEVVIRAFDKVINYQELEEAIPVSSHEEVFGEEKIDQVDSDCQDGTPNRTSKDLLMSPITLHMTQSKLKDPTCGSDEDYISNRVMFSRFETPAVLPGVDHFGGGATKGMLVKPCGVQPHHASACTSMKHCGTRDLELLSDNNWVIPRVNDSFCDSILDISLKHDKTPSPLRTSHTTAPTDSTTTGDHHREHAKINHASGSVSIKPAMFNHHPKLRHKVGGSCTTKKAGGADDFFSISRPLSAQKEKSKPSPRHVVLVDRAISS